MLSDEYIDMLEQAWSFIESQMRALELANNEDFNDTVKCNILKSKIEGKYISILANDSFTVGNLAINTSAILYIYLNIKY